VLQAEKAAKILAKKAEGVAVGPDPIAIPSGEKEGQGVADVFSATTETTAALVAVASPPEAAQTLSSHKEMQPPSHRSPAASLSESEAEQLELQQELLAVESLVKHPQDGDGMDLTEKGFRLRAKFAAELFDDWTAPAGSEMRMADDDNKDGGAPTESHVDPGAAAAATTADDVDDDDDSWMPWVNF
jgi:hypothetical protein